MTTDLTLLQQVSVKIRVKHYSIRTEEAYLGWIKRFIFFHNKQHPRQLRAQYIEQFLRFSNGYTRTRKR